jgi:hypothetical protein
MNPFGSGWHLDRAVFDESLREQVRFVCDNGVMDQNKVVKGRFAGVRKDERGWIMTTEESELNVGVGTSVPPRGARGPMGSLPR